MAPPPMPLSPNWNLQAENYPTAFLIEETWVAGSGFPNELYSFLESSTVDSTEHGAKTCLVVQTVAHGLPKKKIVLVSHTRLRQVNAQNKYNLPEALIGVQVMLQPGDLVVVNLGPASADSFARDELVSDLLNQITDRLSGIVVLAAGNTIALLEQTLTSDSVVVGGVLANNQPSSRYGPFVTCYQVVPFDLPDMENHKTFNHSSAATAYTAGMVLMMLNYARSKGLTLTARQVVGLLKANSDTIQVLSNPPVSGSIPNWGKLHKAIDALV